MIPARTQDVRNERGIALVVALLVLLVMSLLAVVLMMSVNVDTKITSHGLRESSALNSAEAGVGEALARIRNQDILLGNNPRAVAQIFLTVPGSVPVLGTDSTGFATAQPNGAWLAYSTPQRGPDALTVAYKTDPARTVIFRYDPHVTPHIQTASGYPIYVVTATGRSGGDLRRIQTEVIQKPMNVLAKGAMVAEQGIDFLGNADVCGMNHSISTPVGTRISDPCSNYELGWGASTGAWSADTITASGSSHQRGSPAIANRQTGFYTGPWDCFNMSQSAFYSWVTKVNSEPANPMGIYYVDNNSIGQDATGNFAYHGGDGEGLLYLDGDCTINGNFNFKGLIYIEGDLKINGTCWILGGLVVKGKTRIRISNGSLTVLYSSDALSQYITKYGGQFVNLSWRELN